MVYLLYEATENDDGLLDQGAEGGAGDQPFLLLELAGGPRRGDGDYKGRGNEVAS
jgi:hypothetical protein